MMADGSNTGAIAPRMVTGRGQSDTHSLEITDRATGKTISNPHPSAGLDYATITGREIAAMAARPTAEEKSQAPWLIGSSYAAHDARSHEAQRDRGAFHILPVDIDKGFPTLAEVISATQAVVGDVSFLAYSSSSATAECPKWRVLIFLGNGGLPGADYKDTQDALFDLYSEQGIECDRALSRPGQLVFLPNVPPDRRGPDGQPLFYQHHANRAPTLKLDAGHAIVARRENTRRIVREAAQEAMRRRPAPVADRSDDLSPVEHFNAHNSLTDTLARYGYQRQGASDHWKSPNSTTGSYAVRVYEDRAWVSLSGSDLAAGIGAQKEYCCFGDAFDLYVHYEHRGDYKAAVRAYGARMRPAPQIVTHDDLSDFGPKRDKRDTEGDTRDEESSIKSTTGSAESDNAFAMRDTGSPLEWFDDIKPALADAYLVKGLLSQTAMSVVYGPSNSGKTFFAMDLAFHIAVGLEWRGRRVRQAAVLYLAAEGGRGVINRVAALQAETGVSGVPFAVRRAGLDLLTNQADLQAVYDLSIEVTTKHPGLPLIIVIDTLSRVMAGGDENAPSDMTALIRNIDMIREKTDAHIMLVHHTGKDAARGARGHSSLRAATDTEIEVQVQETEDGEQVRAATVTKQRDYNGGETFAFTLKGVLLGEDQDGDEVTSCVVEAADEADFKAAQKMKKGLGGNQKIVVDAWDQLRGEGVGRPNPAGAGFPDPGRHWCVPLDDLKDLAMGKMTAKKPHDAFRDAMDALTANKGLLGLNRGLVWRTDRKLT